MTQPEAPPPPQSAQVPCLKDDPVLPTDGNPSDQNGRSEERPASEWPQVHASDVSQPVAQQEASPQSPQLAFTDAFWGESDHGLEVISRRIKDGKTTLQALEKVVSQRVVIEEEYAKRLSKTARMVTASTELGTLKQALVTFQEELEKHSQTHLDIAARLRSDIDGPVRELIESHREFKRSRLTAAERYLKSKQEHAKTMQLARDRYHGKSVECSHLKEQQVSVSGKDAEKLRTKLEKANSQRKACDAEYRRASDALQEAATLWQRDFRITLGKMEDLETHRMNRMKSLLAKFFEVVGKSVGMEKLSRETVEGVLERVDVVGDLRLFVSTHKTGKEVPPVSTYTPITAGTETLASESAPSSLSLPRRNSSHGPEPASGMSNFFKGLSKSVKTGIKSSTSGSSLPAVASPKSVGKRESTVASPQASSQQLHTVKTMTTPFGSLPVPSGLGDGPPRPMSLAGPPPGNLAGSSGYALPPSSAVGGYPPGMGAYTATGPSFPPEAGPGYTRISHISVPPGIKTHEGGIPPGSSNGRLASSPDQKRQTVDPTAYPLPSFAEDPKQGDGPGALVPGIKGNVPAGADPGGLPPDKNERESCTQQQGHYPPYAYGAPQVGSNPNPPETLERSFHRSASTNHDAQPAQPEVLYQPLLDPSVPARPLFTGNSGRTPGVGEEGRRVGGCRVLLTVT